MTEYAFNLYELAKTIIGPLPINLEFIYAIGVFLLFLVIVFIILTPWIILYKISMEVF